MNWPQILVAVVATYGAILSTYTILANYKATRPSVKVTMSTGFTHIGGAISPPLLFVSAGNVGQKAVTLTSWGIQLPNKTTLISPNPAFTDQQLPHELLTGRSIQAANYTTETARAATEAGFSGIVNLRGFYRDAVGNEYRSKPFKFNIPRWTRDSHSPTD